jgi:hypothetical protein
MSFNICRGTMAAGVIDRLWRIRDIVKVLEDWEQADVSV